MSVLASLTFLCFLSTFFNEYQVHADIDTVKVVVKNVPDYAAGKEKNDLGFLTFDLQADLNPLFNWNVKQLFLYLTAEYETPNNKLNQVVLWDKIILRGENALLDYRSMNTKYHVPWYAQFCLPRAVHDLQGDVREEGLWCPVRGVKISCFVTCVIVIRSVCAFSKIVYLLKS